MTALVPASPVTLDDLVATLKEHLARIDALVANQERLLPSQSRVTNVALDLANGIRKLIPQFEEAGKKHDASRVAFDALARDMKDVVDQLKKLNVLDITSIVREIHNKLALMEGGVTEIKHEVREATDPRLRIPAGLREEGEVERRAGAATKFLDKLNTVSPRTQFVVIALTLIAAVAIATVYILKGG